MTLLNAGALQLYYDHGFLRYIRLHDTEIIRMIYFAVRDHNWMTIPMRITQETLDVSHRHFSIYYAAHCQQGSIDYYWDCTIFGKADGSITFDISGTATSRFLRNRIGFCVLHPLQHYANQAVTITHADQTIKSYRFPAFISPHQPFKDIRAMQWQLADTTFSLTFTGAIFETEDQRNWLDASYKTYCTPLHLPFPVLVQSGDTLQQKIVLTSSPVTAGANQAILPAKHTLTPTTAVYSLPSLGLEANEESLDATTQAHLQALHLSFLRVEMRLHESDWEARFSKRLQQAQILEVPIQLVLFLNQDWEKEQALLQQYQFLVPIQKIIVIDVTQKTLQAPFLQKVLPVLHTRFADVPLGGGTDAYFTEFNRNPPPFPLLDFVAFSVNPQVHAFDELSLIETLETPPALIASTQQLTNLPLSLSPITLRPRTNPDATAVTTVESGDTMPFRVDPRQNTTFAAVWTLGNILAFASAVVQDLTYYQTLGEAGLLMPDRSTLYRGFSASPQEVFPVYSVFKLLGAYRGGTLTPFVSSQPLQFGGFVLQKETRQSLVLINYTAQPIEVEVWTKTYVIPAYQFVNIE